MVIFKSDFQCKTARSRYDTSAAWSLLELLRVHTNTAVVLVTFAALTQKKGTALMLIKYECTKDHDIWGQRSNVLGVFFSLGLQRVKQRQVCCLPRGKSALSWHLVQEWRGLRRAFRVVVELPPRERVRSSAKGHPSLNMLHVFSLSENLTAVSMRQANVFPPANFGRRTGSSRNISYSQHHACRPVFRTHISSRSFCQGTCSSLHRRSQYTAVLLL